MILADTQRRGSLIVGGALILLGVLFLLGQFVEIDIWDYIWPCIIIAFGGLFLIGMAAGGRSAGGLAIPGSVICTIGLILLYQNTFNHWESWAYAWTLIICGVGIGLIIHGLWNESEAIRRGGYQVFKIGFILFLVFGFFFEIIIGISGLNRHNSWLWPIFLIAAGLYLLFGRFFGSGKRDAKSFVPSDKNGNGAVTMDVKPEKVE